MLSTKKSAPGVNDAQGQSNIDMSRSASEHAPIVARQRCSVAQQDFTPEAAAMALHATLHAVTRSLFCLTGGNPHASLIAAHTALKALQAAGDSLAAIAGRGP
jgi:hypothetical protein